MKPVRLLITDTVMLNTGDAAILIGMQHALHAAFGATIEAEVADMQPEAARRLYPGIAFGPTIHGSLARWAGKGVKFKLAVVLTLAVAALWHRPGGGVARRALPEELRRTMARHADVDAVIATGGTYLVPYYRLTPRIVNFLACLALGRPLVLFTQSLGPFRGGASGLLLRAVLRHCRLILVRDDSSRRHLRAIGVPRSRIVMCADAAFALAPSGIRNEITLPANGPLRVAVSLRDWPHFERRDKADGMDTYLDAVAALVCDLIVRHNARVTFVSTCQGAAEYWTDDSHVAQRVVERLPAGLRGAVEIDYAHHQPDSLIARLRDFDVVVATRMHAAILALCSGRPVLGIAYEFKTRELMQRVGFGDLVIDIEDATGERLIALFDRLLELRPGIGLSIGRRVAAERDAALAAGMIVRDALFGTEAAAAA